MEIDLIAVGPIAHNDFENDAPIGEIEAIRHATI